MAIARMGRGADFSLSTGVNLLNAILGLLEDNQNTNRFLVPVDFSGGFYTTLPADVPENSLYVSVESMPLSAPRSLGNKNVSYDDVFVASVFYYNCTVDKEFDNMYLVAVAEFLSNFFTEHSSLNGLCNFGLQVHNARVTNVPHGQYFYNAVAMELVMRVISIKNRVPTSTV